MTKHDRVETLGVLIDDLTLKQAVGRIGKMIQAGGKHLVVTPYVESVVAARTDTDFCRILNNAALSVPDGISLKAAVSFLNLPAGNLAEILANGARVGWWILTDQQRLTGLKAQVTGVDLIGALSQKARQAGWRVFLLGGRGEVAEKAAVNLKTAFPGLLIESFAGSAEVSLESQDDQKNTIARINQFKPDLLFVAYGPIKQEKWLDRNLEHLEVKVAIGVGGAFDYFAGAASRAPLWLRSRGLEWLHRLSKQPWRWRRQLAIPKFLLLVLQEKLKAD